MNLLLRLYYSKQITALWDESEFGDDDRAIEEV